MCIDTSVCVQQTTSTNFHISGVWLSCSQFCIEWLEFAFHRLLVFLFVLLPLFRHWQQKTHSHMKHIWFASTTYVLFFKHSNNLVDKTSHFFQMKTVCLHRKLHLRTQRSSALLWSNLKIFLLHSASLIRKSHLI